jgi:hypothetical protein
LKYEFEKERTNKRKCAVRASAEKDLMIELICEKDLHAFSSPPQNVDSVENGLNFVTTLSFL